MKSYSYFCVAVKIVKGMFGKWNLVGDRFLSMKIIKTIAIFLLFEYTICNRVARSLFGIGDQAETCAQLFYVKEWFYGFEKAIDFWWAIG